MSESVAGAHSESPEEIRKHIRGYLVVGGILYVGTFITVMVATLNLPTPQAIAVALAIASTKATLVALYFMHLIDEKKLIYWTLLLTVTFFALCMAIPTLTVGEGVGVQMHQDLTEKPLHGHVE